MRFAGTLGLDTASAWVYLAFLLLVTVDRRRRCPPDLEEPALTDAVRPVLLVVSRSAEVRDLLREELLRRYDRDYDVVTAAGPDEARDRLTSQAGGPAGSRRSPCSWRATAGRTPTAST